MVAVGIYLNITHTNIQVFHYSKTKINTKTLNNSTSHIVPNAEFINVFANIKYHGDINIYKEDIYHYSKNMQKNA